MKTENIPYIILVKYLTNRCTPEELVYIQAWLADDIENEKYLKRIKKEWEVIQRPEVDFLIPDKKQVWDRIIASIHKTRQQVPLYSKSMMLRISGIAASIALVIGLSFSILINKTRGLNDQLLLKNEIIAPLGQKSQLVLPDGTSVWLNSGSRLLYSNQFGNIDRTVVLEGEAFFDVQRNEALPFVVKAGEIDVKVLGTTFNVNAYLNESEIEVSLLRGSVKMLSSESNKLLAVLQPNQKATFNTMENTCIVNPCDADLESSWHLNFLRFEGTPSQEVWQKLERWYGVNITLENDKVENRYWFTVKTESLTELLNTINRITPIEYQLKGEEVLIIYK